jgi:NADP-reducing hydrogenase subunit HndB
VKSLQELRELRAELEKEISARNGEGKPKIIIGMGTCGIAAGARDILQAVSQEVRKRNLDVITTQTGCIGMCEQEPLIDIQLPGQDRITYGRVTAKDVERIVVEHVVNGHVVEELAIARLEEGGI